MSEPFRSGTKPRRQREFEVRLKADEIQHLIEALSLVSFYGGVGEDRNLRNWHRITNRVKAKLNDAWLEFLKAE